jgi:hypothetical protein
MGGVGETVDPYQPSRICSHWLHDPLKDAVERRCTGNRNVPRTKRATLKHLMRLPRDDTRS